MRYVAGFFQGWFQALAMTMLLVACSASQTASEIAPPITGAVDAGNGIKKMSMDVNKYPITKTVCDPFGDNPDPRSNQGLKAELWWLEAGTPRQSSVGAMIAKGVKSDRTLFFSQLNVRTRMFNMGFANDTGSTVKADDGTTLIEYFALRFKSILRLAPEQAEGKYEFAVLSDDGATLNFRGADGFYHANVNNDGNHPTRLGCGVEPVTMARDTELPMFVDYYQGPRYHIAMIVLMREYNPNRPGLVQGKDPACGVTGNDTWFDPNNGSTAKKAYMDLLARGWKPLDVDNYGLPNDAMFNPCKDGDVPVISDFKVYERYIDGFVVTWTTDVPATSQVVSTDANGVQTLTVADNVLRTSHEVRVTGLKARTAYKLQAVSISETYGRAVSREITETTDF